MASTITPATLTVTITAAISLAGQDKGFSHSYTIASVTEVINRIIAVPTTEMMVLNFTATNPGSVSAIGLNEACPDHTYRRFWAHYWLPTVTTLLIIVVIAATIMRTVSSIV